MSNGDLNWIANFMWGIADDILRDVYVRGKYRDVILPMTVIRRIDAVLEPTKKDVLKMKRHLDEAGIANQDAALRLAAEQAFYNISAFTLRDLKARGKTQQLKADFIAYLDGFSPNVQEILEKFKFRNQIQTLVDADVLGYLIEKFLDTSINLSPHAVKNPDGSTWLPGLDNHGMGTIFEELIRRFNEENNEEAGEHFTPRDVVRLMAELVFQPIVDRIQSGTYLIYDGACGTGGMLTVAEKRVIELAQQRGTQASVHLYGQEVNPETYAITKADLLLKGEGEEADNIWLGSTLSQDSFPTREFDFMLSNPPYGKSWKVDLDRLGGKDGLSDPRFIVTHAGDPQYTLVTRSNDGQLMFLANMLSKMKANTPLGSRIAEVHNGSALFTGDAGQGESNVRRWIIENDWLEAVVALPLSIFYNTGIATYIWLLTNRKQPHRLGKVQLIDATDWFRPLRKNLGKKNCELSEEDIRRITNAFMSFENSDHSKIVANAALGYQKITIERPLRLRVVHPTTARERLRDACGAVGEGRLADLIDKVVEMLGVEPGNDFNRVVPLLKETLEQHGVELTQKRADLVRTSCTTRDETAAPVFRKVHRSGDMPGDPVHGFFPAVVNGEHSVVEYEPDPELREIEEVPLLYEGGVESFFTHEVTPSVPDAWIGDGPTKIGYEISFAEHFSKRLEARTLERIRADLDIIGREARELLEQILRETAGLK